MNGDRGSNGRRRRWTVVASALAIAAVVLGSVTLAGAGSASPLPLSGGVSNADCSTKTPDPNVAPGTKEWQFNLTGASDPESALLTASFSDGTSVSGQGPDNTPGSVAMWFITTSATATVTSASATFSGTANNLVVSHCLVATTTTTMGGGTPGTPGTPGAEVGGESVVAGSNAAGAIEAAPSLTG